MPDLEQVMTLRNEGKSIREIAVELKTSVSTVKRRLKESVKDIYPRYQMARIVKPCPNKRTIIVSYDGLTRVAIKKPQLNFRNGQEVTLELIDAETCRVI